MVLLCYTGIAFVSDQRDLAIFGATLVGACVGFLWFNSFPAAVFMGDTGSYALGGAIAAMAVMTKTEILLVVIGAIFVAEALSVIIQVIVFKRFQRRVFLMTPVHHHFEMAAWSETKIIVRFWLIAAIFAAVGLHALLPRLPEPARVSAAVSASATTFAPRSVGAFRFTGWSADWDDGRHRPPLRPGRRRITSPSRTASRCSPSAAWATPAAPPSTGPPGCCTWWPGSATSRRRRRRASRSRGRRPAPRRPASSAASTPRGWASSPGRNRLPEIGRGVVFPSARDAAEPPAPAGLTPRSLVPVGGGKDSVVSLAALAAAGEEVVALSVGRKPSADAAAAAEGVPMLHVERHIRPGAVRPQRRRGLQRPRPDHRDRLLRRAGGGAARRAATRW